MLFSLVGDIDTFVGDCAAHIREASFAHPMHHLLGVEAMVGEAVVMVTGVAESVACDEVNDGEGSSWSKEGGELEQSFACVFDVVEDLGGEDSLARRMRGGIVHRGEDGDFAGGRLGHLGEVVREDVTHAFGGVVCVEMVEVVDEVQGEQSGSGAEVKERARGVSTP